MREMKNKILLGDFNITTGIMDRDGRKKYKDFTDIISKVHDIQDLH